MSLISPNHEEYEYICDLIKDRIEEGQGETIYEIGTGGKVVSPFLLPTI